MEKEDWKKKIFGTRTKNLPFMLSPRKRERKWDWENIWRNISKKWPETYCIWQETEMCISRSQVNTKFKDVHTKTLLKFWNLKTKTNLESSPRDTSHYPQGDTNSNGSRFLMKLWRSQEGGTTFFFQVLKEDY